MENRTQVLVIEFILLGFHIPQDFEIIIFLLLLLMYLSTLSSNLIIILLIWIDHRLHSPMYFFLSNLSFLGIWFTSTIVPKLLSRILLGKRTISFTGCMLQCYFYFLLGTTEYILLAVMSFDRYMAICNPLRYTVIMSGRVCLGLVLASWVGGFLNIISPFIMILRLSFCSSNIINHFFCDSSPLIHLSCTDTTLLVLVVYISASAVLLSSLLLTMVSYIYIISTILKISSAQDRRKSFSTCTSHIIVVTIAYGTAIFLYVKPAETGSLNVNKAMSLLTTVVTPLINPFVYTLRNKQVKEALVDVVRKNRLF
ncbi:olfactory receptor 6M1-like [Rhinatrema bivittatum]|uniref:olfactory receptor 6M1-like n=1 Tax=Rhinatrema bivittatum TaxID=194408 RepID=UPI00112D3D45|nr:olfactory receptor 6M1-like [Rhinatrema bivittatum]